MILLFVWSQASVARLEQQLADCESALVEEKVVSEDRKHQAEQCQYQVDIIESLKALYCVSFLYFCWLAWKKIASRVHIWSILLFINTIININKEVILYCFKNHPWHINGCKLSPQKKWLWSGVFSWICEPQMPFPEYITYTRGKNWTSGQRTRSKTKF